MKNLTILILLAVLLAAVVAQQFNGDNPTAAERAEFKKWMKQHRKKYGSKEEEQTALTNWTEHKRTIDDNNRKHRRGQSSHEMSLQSHADMTHDEIKYHKTGAVHPDGENMRNKNKATRDDHLSFPTGPKSVDWRKKNLVGPVRLQKCRDCWAFSTTGVIEGLLRRKNNTVKLSEQNLVDCAEMGGLGGCEHGGYPHDALEWVEEKGITSEKKYPYRNGVEGKCDYDGSDMVTKVKNVVQVDTLGNETLLRDIVAHVGPVSILICVGKFFQFHHNGIYKEDNCCMSTDHAILLIGYGTDAIHGDYWIIKNSWGTGFGQNGFMKFARNYPEENGNMCNIAQMAVYAELK